MSYARGISPWNTTPKTSENTPEVGDSVFAAYEAHDAPAVGEDPMLMEISYDFEIVGGTGQYEGASGGGQLAAMMAWPGFEPNYWPALVLIDGTITY